MHIQEDRRREQMPGEGSQLHGIEGRFGGLQDIPSTMEHPRHGCRGDALTGPRL